MKTIRFIGDIHGDLDYYMLAVDVENGSDLDTVQIGDFGIGFIPRDPDAYDDFFSVWEDLGASHRFIRGNHDNPSDCAQIAHWIPDGTIEDNVLYVGGASSIDRQWRTPGLDWWADEECSQEKLDEIVELWKSNEQLDTIVSHECPEFFANEVMIPYAGFVGVPPDYSRTRLALQRMHFNRAPKLHVFGHWHRNLDYLYKTEFGETRFVCVGVNQTKDLDV